MNYDDLKFSVEAMSGGKNTVILDDLGKPSVMVSVPKMKYSDIIDDGSDETLPCFIVDGQELDQIWVSKYHNIVENDRAYSLPNKDPQVSINHDRAVEVCRNKGEGWCLMPNGLWGAIQGWCLKNEFMPHGNGNYGSDFSNAHEKGVCSYSDDGERTCRTGTGTGPVTWYHDGTDSGIADIAGNVADWCSGMRLMDGEIQIIPDGNCMKSDCDLSEDSSEWRAIMPDGSFVPTGTDGTLKYDCDSSLAGARVNSEVEFTTESGISYLSKFSNLGAKDGVNVPDILRVSGLYPLDNRSYGLGAMYNRSIGERIPRRGGGYTNTNAGIHHLDFNGLRAYEERVTGFRSAYYGAL